MLSTVALGTELFKNKNINQGRMERSHLFPALSKNPSFPRGKSSLVQAWRLVTTAVTAGSQRTLRGNNSAELSAPSAILRGERAGRDAGVRSQKFRSSEVQKFRSSGVSRQVGSRQVKLRALRFAACFARNPDGNILNNFESRMKLITRMARIS